MKKFNINSSFLSPEGMKTRDNKTRINFMFLNLLLTMIVYNNGYRQYTCILWEGNLCRQFWVANIVISYWPILYSMVRVKS